MLRCGLALAAAIALASACTDSNASGEGTTYKVYFLGGQSNMEGYGYVAELPTDLVNGDHDVPIFHGRNVPDGADGGGVGIWVPLTAGHGTGFVTDGKINQPADRFGPELSFGMAMAARWPDEHIAIIKYARGGTGLVDGVSEYGSWDPEYTQGNTRNQFDNALTAISQAMRTRDVDRDGIADRLIPAGIIWMQGEADATNNHEAAASYDTNLARLMTLLRAAMGNEDLPVIIGQIMGSGETPQTQVMRYSHEVQSAQARFVQSDPCARLVTATQGFSFLPDGWHYTSPDYVTLGKAFASAANELEANCSVSPSN